MTAIKNYTTIEQSKKLLKLGLNPESADMIHWKLPKDEYYECENIIWLDSVHTLRRKGLVGFDETRMEIIPAWSLSTLLELMPYINDGISNCKPTLGKNFFKGISYQCGYIRKSVPGCAIASFISNTPIEAAYSMVVWLIENGYIKTEKK